MGQHLRGAVAVAVALVATVSAGSAPAASASADEARGWARPLVAEALGSLSPQLVGVPVEGTGYRQAYDAWETSGRELAAAVAHLAAAELVVADLSTLRAALADQLLERHRHRLVTEAAAAAAHGRLVEVAVGDFVGGSPAASPLARLAAGGDASEPLRAMVLGDAAADATERDLDRAQRARDQAVVAERQTAAALAQVERRHDEAVQARAAAAVRRGRWEGQRAAAATALVSSAAVAMVAGTDLRVLALDAYWKGAASHGTACGLSWSVLAGIGRVESRHGTYGGRDLDGAGTVLPSIVGIPLDGTNNTALIGDSDGGALDGDPTIDRAVGPMQFIPTTWRAWGTDGNGDGRADPNNLYDAAAAAARYLCRTGGGDVQRAVLSYNRSQAYVVAVLGHADGYAAAVRAHPPV